MRPSTAAQAPPHVPARPQLKPWYRLVETGETVVLEHAQAVLVFEGRAARRLLPSLLALLDGTRTVEEIVAELGEEAAAGVEHALSLLADKRLLLDGPRLAAVDPSGMLETVELLASLGAESTPDEIRAALAEARVSVFGSGEAAPFLATLLRDSGVGSVDRGGWPDAEAPAGAGAAPFAVVAPARDEVPQVEAWNRRAVAEGRPWLQVLPFDGLFAAIGPLYVPGETCCFECYRLRRRATSGYADEFGAIEAAPLAAPAGPALAAAAAGIGALLALRWLAYRDQRLPGVFLALEAAGTALSPHRVYRVPRCRACSDVRDVAPPLPWHKETRPLAVTAL